MLSETSYNLGFLNSYFTTEEFDFINNSNSETQKLDEIIIKENHTRDIIVNLINSLNDSISNLDSSHSNEDFLQLLTEVQNIFEKINYNIKLIHDLKSASSDISDRIVQLLIQVESNPSNQNSYNNLIQELKDEINAFSLQSEEVKSQVLLNDIKIDTFFQKNIVKKYLSSFEIEISNKTNKKNHVNINNKKSERFNINDIEENHILRISEKSKKVFLPYTKAEIALYLEQYPDEYTSFKDVVKKEFVLSLDYYMKHPVLARFREAYSLIRDRESKSVIDAFKYALDIMFRYELNPVIIAACKTQDQLENYLSCLEKNKLDDFKDFEIQFEINPI